MPQFSDTIKYSNGITTAWDTTCGVLKLLTHMRNMKTLTQVGGLEPKPKRDLLMTDFEVVEVTDFPRYSYHVLLSYWCMLPCILLTCYTKLYWCMLTCYTGIC